MTQSRLTLLLVGGGLLLLTPLLSRYLQADNSIFSVMSTLTEVRENLEEKRLRLQELVRQMGRGRDPAEIARKAEEHHKSGKEIHDLSLNFITVAHTKFPRYSAFLANVRERVLVTYRDIDHLARVAEGKAPMPMATMVAEAPVTNTRPAPRTERASEQAHGAVVAGDVAPPDTSGPNLPTVRPGAASVSGVPAGAILTEVTAARVPSDIIVVEKPKAVAPLVPGAAPVTKKAAAIAAAPAPSEALRERYKTAYQHFVRGSPDALAEAKHGFTELLRDEPNYYLARYWLVKTHIQLGETDAAKRQAQELIRTQPQLQTARDLARQLKLPLPDAGAAPAQGVPAELASTGSAVTPLPGEQATGATIGANFSLENPVAVLVEWRVGAGLPSGISRAALIHELPDAKDDSRLVAVFKALGDKPPRVGPLAAADPGLLSLARTYGAVAAVHAGRVADKTVPAGLALIDAKKAPAAFVKDELRPAPYNQFVHLLTAAVEAAVPVEAAPAALGAFPRQESATVGAAPAPRLAITRGGRRIEFRYEERTGMYIRQTGEGRDAVDAGDSAPLAVANLIVQKGAPAATGTTVIVHRGGQVLEARLTRDPEAPLVNSRGRPILLNPGAIWVLGERLAPVPPAPMPMASADGWVAPSPAAPAAASVGAKIAAGTTPKTPASPAPPVAGSTLAAVARLSATSNKPAAKPAPKKPVATQDYEDEEVLVADGADVTLPPELASDAALGSPLTRPKTEGAVAGAAVATQKAKAVAQATFDGASVPAKPAEPGWAADVTPSSGLRTPDSGLRTPAAKPAASPAPAKSPPAKARAKAAKPADEDEEDVEDLDAALAVGEPKLAKADPPTAHGRAAAIAREKLHPAPKVEPAHAPVAIPATGGREWKAAPEEAPVAAPAPARIGRIGANVGAIRPAAASDEGQAPLGSETVARLARSRLDSARSALKNKATGAAGAGRATFAAVAQRASARAAELKAKAVRGAAEDKAAVLAGDGGPEPVDDEAVYDSDPSGIKIKSAAATVAAAPRTAPHAGMDDARTAAPPQRKAGAPRPPPARIAPVPVTDEE